MTSLAQRIMEVLKQHHLHHTEYICGMQDCTAFRGSMGYIRLEMIQHDLLALFPHPSREALEKLLRSWQTKDSISVGFPSGTIKIDAGLLDVLMAWATGESTEPRVWCEHIIKSPIVTDHREWHLKGTGIYCETFDFCPKCATPRPSAG